LTSTPAVAIGHAPMPCCICDVCKNTQTHMEFVLGGGSLVDKISPAFELRNPGVQPGAAGPASSLRCQVCLWV
jgi:hypothetical protein